MVQAKNLLQRISHVSLRCTSDICFTVLYIRHRKWVLLSNIPTKKLILFCKLLRFLRSKSSPRTTKKKKKEKKEKKEGPFQRWIHPDWRNGGSRERTTTTPTTPTYRRKCPAFLFFLPKKKNKNKAEYSTSNATSGGHSLKNRDFWLSKENTNRRTDALSY